MGDQKAADDKKEANAQNPIEQPPKKRVEAFGKSAGTRAVMAEHNENAHGAPAVKGGKSRGLGH